MYDYKSKNLNTKRELEFLLSKTLSMFMYDGLPESIPQRDLERQLQTKGYAFITKVKGKLYSFTGGLGGEPDPYGNPTEIVIANPALKFNKTLNLKEDGVLVRNDSMQAGIKNLLEKHVVMMNENEITMIMNSFTNRMPTLMSAGDDTTRESAEAYLRQIIDGELGIIAENRLFEGINAQGTGGQGSTYTQLIEYQQYIKASLYNELGLEMNNNMKRERLTEDEVNMVDVIYPFVDNMMMNRKEAFEEVNKMYDTSIEIQFDSVWAQADESTDEEFLMEVDMHLQQLREQAQPQAPTNELDLIFGDTTDEELEDILNQLLELDKKGDETIGNNDDRGIDGTSDSTDRVETSIGPEPESGTSDTDIGASGTTRTDGDGPDFDNTRPSDEPGARDTAIDGERDLGESEPGDKPGDTDRTVDTEPERDNTKPGNESSERNTELDARTDDESGTDVDTKDEQSDADSGIDIRRDPGIGEPDDRTTGDSDEPDSSGDSTSDSSGGTGERRSASEDEAERDGQITSESGDTSTPNNDSTATPDSSTETTTDRGHVVEVDVDIVVERDEANEIEAMVSLVENEVEVSETIENEQEVDERDKTGITGSISIEGTDESNNTDSKVEIEILEIEEPEEEIVLIVEEPDTIVITEEEEEVE